jgi:hypothetical protein
LQTSIYNNQEAENPADIQAIAQKTMMIQSYVICCLYLLLAVLTYFFFFHHPSHIGIQVRKSKDNVINIGFNIDKTASWFGSNG